MSSRPSVAIVRFAPWMTFKNAHPHDLMWPCTLLYVAGIARRLGCPVDLLDLHVETLDLPGIVARVVSSRPDIVILDTMTPTASLAKQVSVQLRERLPSAVIVGVGQHATEASAHLLAAPSGYDGVVRGEPEASLRTLFEGTPLREVPGSAWLDGDRLVEHGGKQELRNLDEELPPLDPTGLDLDAYRMRSVAVPQFGQVRWGFLLTSRGCPYPCTFCSPTLRQSYGTGFRAHSAERVVDDMERLYRDHGVTAFYTIDDVFSLHKGRVKKICELLIARRLPIHWTIQTRADLLDDAMCTLLRRAGCVAVKMGIESGVPRILELIRKDETREEMLSAAHAVRRAGMSLTAYYMLGHPSETRDEMFATMRYAHEIDADMIQVAFHTPYPGSATWDEFRDRVSDLDELNHYETQHLNASLVGSAELEALQRRFYLEYYFSPRILARYARKRLLYRLTDREEWRLAFLTLRYLALERGKASASS